MICLPLNSLHPYASLVELEANVDTIATVIDLSNCAIVIVKNGYSTFPPYSDLVYLG
jgi:hypothetical protein